MHIVLLRVSQALCLLLGALVFRSLLFVARLLWARHRYDKLKIPGPPLSKFIFGHLFELAGHKGPWNVAAMSQQYGPLFKLQLLDGLQVVLTDPDTVQRITKRTGPGPYMPKPRELYAALEKAIRPAIPSILTADDGAYWKAVRQAAAPCFSNSNLKSVAPLVLELTKRVADRMVSEAAAAGGSAIVDVTDGAKRITSDVMGQLLLGEDLQGTYWKPSEYLEVLYPVIRAQGEMINNPWYMWQLWRADVRHQRYCLARHNAIMTEKIERIMAHPPTEYTIAAHLLKARIQPGNTPLSRDQLKSEVATFMAAGFETTSHAISWVLAALAAHQDIQQQVVEELVSLGLAPAEGASYSPDSVRDIDPSDFGRLPYMSAVIKEVLRLCPPAPWGGTKVVPEDTELCGYHVPKGTYVMIPLLPLALAKYNYGPDADVIKPERWLSSSSSSSSGSDGSSTGSPGGSDKDSTAAAAAAVPASNPDPMTFMVGPRDCIGQALAKVELQVVLATMLGRFRFLPGPKLQQELDTAKALGQPPVVALHALAGVHVTLQPEDGQMLLQIEQR